jgi:NADPH:quinone reductase-like Zn-dependent oxidoreductase
MTMVEHDLRPGDWLAQTAAGSTVGQLVLQLARSERFRTVNIVRRRAQVPDIKALGGDVVITSEDNDWGTQLATTSEGKALSRAIDCVAGKPTLRHLRCQSCTEADLQCGGCARLVPPPLARSDTAR